ncbi:MAG: site-2 protease family protein [Candidatus Korarchaeota archaeon]|nr:site-2 protease family protein [Candidatus Korarchaeota archaeon]NIU85387.1 hypothetical protein [Candidatus Thorarchaeota archaeon]NIW15485.1 hypothetical protein [Candidatus Thorarchaeota archaeon]NIW53429.1 hypothetical protein [Candidatus Korarchaeota archaeon]
MYESLKTPFTPPASLEEIQQHVETYFDVVSSSTEVHGSIPIYLYRIEKEVHTKQPFKRLLADVREKDYTVFLQKGDTSEYLRIIAVPSIRQPRSVIRGQKEAVNDVKERMIGEKEKRKEAGDQLPTWTIVSLLLTLVTITFAGYLLTSAFGEFSTIPLILTIFFYVLSLFSIILFHELGHMIASKMHGIETTYPIFLPGLPTIGGSFGAYIREKEPPVNRDELLDIGLMGPVFGFIVAMIVTVVGILLSKPNSNGNSLSSLPLPLLYQYLSQVLRPATGNLNYHPIAFAGWVGFLITGLNLLPASQLDGGHVSRALFKGKIHRILTYVIIGILLLVGLYLMAFLLFFITRGRHPPPLDDVSPLTTKRKIFAVLSWLLVVLTFPPLQFSTLSTF